MPPNDPKPAPPPRPPRRRPFHHRRKGNRRKHHLKPATLARVRAYRASLAAWRKRHGITIHHKFHHRKTMTPAQRLHFILAVRAAAARRKAMGLHAHRYLSPLARARLIARLRAMRHSGPRNVNSFRIKSIRSSHRPRVVSNRAKPMRFRIKSFRFVSANPIRRHKRRKPF